MKELVLGIDIGTSSSKGVLARPDGAIVATGARAHSLSLPRPGWAEHDAEKVWWADFTSLCRELVPSAGGSLAAICVSGIGPCVLAVDAQGRPLRPAILYGIDVRATRENEELTARYGAENVLRMGGSQLTSQAAGSKLLWLQRHEAEIWKQMRYFLMSNSFIVYRLTGEYVLDHPSASQCNPLYDLRKNSWTEQWAAEIVPGLQLPSLLWPSEVAGQVTQIAARETGIPAGTPVVMGTLDAYAEAVSVGVREPGERMLMYGTTMFLLEICHQAQFHPQFWSTTGILRHTQAMCAGMATSGALTGWLRHMVGDPPYETLLAEAAVIAPGAEGLVILPYFAGERAPLFDPKARGLICGLSLIHQRGHLYRAVLEATAYGLRHILEVMYATQARDRRLVAVGGGTKGRLWMQIVSDVTGASQELPRETIGASYGDAQLAAIATGLAKLDDRWNTTSALIEPEARAHEAYASLYKIFRELYPATRSQLHRLADLQENALAGEFPLA
jgi:xylulokinase